MKHIAIFDPVGKRAGMHYYSGSLAKALVQNGVKASVYSNFIGVMPNEVTYHKMFTGKSPRYRYQKLFYLLKGGILASIDAKKRGVDMVILHLFSANMATFLFLLMPKLLRLKSVIIAHDVASLIDEDNRFLQKQIYNTLANTIVVHNQFSYERLLAITSIKNPSKVKIFKHGGYQDYTFTPLNRDTLCQKMGLDTNSQYILFFGQIKKVKGLDILLNALTQTPPSVKLIIAGKPWRDDFSFYEDLIVRLKLEQRVIKKIGFIEESERQKLFSVVDVNILPYRTIFQSGVLLMSMSQGVPIIASDLPPNREIITHNINGLLFESENTHHLAQTICFFFNTPHQSQMRTNTAKQTIRQNHCWKEIAKNYISVLQ